VSASTLNGRVYYASKFQPHGRYAFSSHNGKLYVGVPSDQQLDVKLSSFNGQVQSSVPAPDMSGHGMRFKHAHTFRFTTGEAPEAPGAPAAPDAPEAPDAPRAPLAPQTPQLELESFAGYIQLLSQAEALRVIDRRSAAFDSARVALRRARYELARLHRMGRPEPAPAPEAPSPPPNR